MSGGGLLGFVVAIIGAVVLYFGVSGSNSLVDQASETLTGRYTRETMTDIIIDTMALVGGALTALMARR
jgi:hypothetical protein